MSVPYPLAEVINASGAEPDRAIWCDVDVKLTTGRIGLTGRTKATQLEYVVSPLAMSKLTNGHFLIGEVNFHTPAGYVVVRSHERQPNDRIAILYRCRSCSAKYDNDVGMLGMCRSCLLDKSIAAAVADIEACGGTPDAMQASPDMVRQFETYRSQPPDYIDPPSGRIKLIAEPGAPSAASSSDELLKQRKAERVQRERDRREALALRRFGSAAENTTTNTIEVRRANGGPMESTTPCNKCGIPWVKCRCGGYVQPPAKDQFYPVDLKAEAEANGYKESDILKLGEPAKPVDPLDVEYDGVKLRTLIDGDEFNRREASQYYRCMQMTPVQRAAVSAHWSAQLRAKVAAAKAAERNVVTYCEVDADE